MSIKIHEILSNWDIPQNLPIHRIDESGNAHVWVIGETYILKKGKHESQLKNFRLYEALAVQGLNPPPFYTKNGTQFAEDSDEAVYSLLPYIQGNTLTTDEMKCEKMLEYAYKIGQGIAKLHQALLSIENEFEVGEGYTLYSNANYWIPQVKKANIEFEMGLTDSFFNDYAEAFGGLHDKLPRQLIHQDIHPQNIIFDNNEVSGFIDFELSSRNMRLYDISRILTGLGFNFFNAPEQWLAIVKQTLTGYNRVNPLTDEEKKGIFYLMCCAQFIHVGMDLSVSNSSVQLTSFIAGLKDRLIEIGLGVS